MTEPIIDFNHPQYEAKIVDMRVNYPEKGKPPESITLVLILRRIRFPEEDIIVQHSLTLPIPTEEETKKQTLLK